MPDSIHPLAEPFRHSLRGIASSVTIITTQIGGVRYGMVATAVMSLSMEPPSLVIAVNSSASIHEPLTRRGAFAINVLADWDERVARGFAASKGEARFAYGAWSSKPVGASEFDNIPYLANGQSTIFCRLSDRHSSGSHSLFIGEVEHVIVSAEKAPLTYCDGIYGSFSPRAQQFQFSRSA